MIPWFSIDIHNGHLSNSGSKVRSESNEGSESHPSQAPKILRPSSLTVEPINDPISGLTIERGRSDHHRFQGGGTAVPNISPIFLDWDQFNSRSLTKMYQDLFRQSLSSGFSPPLEIAPLKGSPSGSSVGLRPIIPANSETLLGWSKASVRSAAHQSLLYADGTRDLLFSRNSPNPIRISPLSQIETTLSLIIAQSSMVSTLLNSPSSRITIGPSISVHGVTAQALPGRSIFI